MGQHELAIDAAHGRVRKTFTSWQRGEPERELAALEMAAGTPAAALVPRPLGRGVHADGRPWVEMEYVGGAAATGPYTKRQTGTLADALVTLAGLCGPTFPALVERVDARRELRDAVLAEVARLSAEGADLGAAADVLRDVVEPLEACVPVELDCFGQGDGNGANFLWAGDRLRVIDFENSGASDLAFEVAEIVEHVSTRLPGWLDLERFIDAVGTRAHLDAIALHEGRVILATYWVVRLLPGRSGERRNPPGSLVRQVRHLTGLLDGSS